MPFLPTIAIALLLGISQAGAQPASGHRLLDPLPLSAPGAQPVPVPRWSEEEFRALTDAWQHTAGVASFEYRVAHFADEAKARQGWVSKWVAGHVDATTQSAAGLVDVPPELRVALSELHAPGRSPLLRTPGPDGRLRWSVVELVQRGEPRPPRDAADFSQQAVRWVRDGLLPPPRELLADPAHRARAAFWPARSADAVRAMPAELSPDVRFGNLLTPLTAALLSRQVDTAQALLERGADPNLCGSWGCPLHVAATALQDDTQAEAMVGALLRAGARVDQVDAAFAAAASTPLAQALLDGRAQLAEQLLAAGAAVDGVAGARYTPLQAAFASGRRDSAERLIERGATALPLPDRSIDRLGIASTVVQAAQESGDASLLRWAEQLLVEQALRSPRFRWDAHLEQDGRRFALADGATVALRAAPFKLVLTIPAGSEAAVAVAASFSSTLADEVRGVERRNGIFVPALSNTSAEPPADESYRLFTYETRPAPLTTEPNWGGHMTLTPPAPGERGDFHEVRERKREYVREFRAVAEVANHGGGPVPTTPLAALQGRQLTLALGAGVAVEPPFYMRLVAPRVVTLSLR